MTWPAFVQKSPNSRFSRVNAGTTANSPERSWLTGSSVIGPWFGAVALVAPGIVVGAGGCGGVGAPTGSGATPTPKNGSP